MLLKRKGANYEDILVSKSAVHRQEMEKRSGQRSVPQVFIDDQAVGGFDELLALEKSGQLDQLLGVADGAP
jgi:glutaredoxin 3